MLAHLEEPTGGQLERARIGAQRAGVVPHLATVGVAGAKEVEPHARAAVERDRAVVVDKFAADEAPQRVARAEQSPLAVQAQVDARPVDGGQHLDALAEAGADEDHVVGRHVQVGRRSPGPVHNCQPREADDLVGLAPFRQLRQDVGAHQEEHFSILVA